MAWIELTSYGKKMLVNSDFMARIEPQSVLNEQRQQLEGSAIYFGIPRQNDLSALHGLQVEESPREIERRLNAVSTFVGR